MSAKVDADPATQTPSPLSPNIMSVAQPSNPEWLRSDAYHNSFLIHKDDALDSARENSAANGLRDIAVSPAQGKLLNLLALSIGAKRILEVGTLGG
jgi:predicted O-methyltransferase YrrM